MLSQLLARCLRVNRVNRRGSTAHRLGAGLLSRPRQHEAALLPYCNLGTLRVLSEKLAITRGAPDHGSKIELAEYTVP